MSERRSPPPPALHRPRLLLSAPVRSLLAAVVFLLPSTLPARAAEPAPEDPGTEMAAVEVQGTAVLRICRTRMFSADCRTYGHIDVPDRIALGDRFPVTFGSNPKRITFRVQTIRLNGAGCEIYGSVGDDQADRLSIQRCSPSAPK